MTYYASQWLSNLDLMQNAAIAPIDLGAIVIFFLKKYLYFL